MKNDSGARRRGEDSKGNRGTAVQSCSSAGHSGTNCLLVRQGESACKSNVACQLTASTQVSHVAKQPHSVVECIRFGAKSFKSLWMIGGYQRVNFDGFAARNQ